MKADEVAELGRDSAGERIAREVQGFELGEVAERSGDGPDEAEVGEVELGDSTGPVAIDSGPTAARSC